MDLHFKKAREIKKVVLDDCMPTLDEFIAVAKYGAELDFSEALHKNVRANRMLLEKFLKSLEKRQVENLYI